MQHKNINTVFNININEIPQVYTVQNIKKEETITLKTEWNISNGHHNCKASVNVVPLQEYISVTNDVYGNFIKKNRFKTILAYGDKQWSIKGERDIIVNREKHSILIIILIVDGKQFHVIQAEYRASN